MADTHRPSRDRRDPNRVFVADVAHELRERRWFPRSRSPILREHLDDLPVDKGPGELPVTDVGGRSSTTSWSRASTPGAEQIAVELVGRRGGARRLAMPSYSQSARDGWSECPGNLLDNAREHAAAAPVDVSLD